MVGPNVPLRRVAPLLFGSGFCALVYQITWFREFRLVFGSSTAASAAVLAIFMGGIGFGGLWLGKKADRHPQPLFVYAALEIGISLFALLTPVLLALVRWIYIALGGTTVLGSLGGTAVRLVLATIVLAIPTLLMGGTLPAAARAVETDDDAGRRGVGVLYGVNTLGAVTGSLVVTFLLLEVFGTTSSLHVAALINLLVAVVALAIARKADPTWVSTNDYEQAKPDKGAGHARFVLVAAAVVGFAFFLMEVVWFRMLGPILGGTVYTFGLILAVALLGIGLGGALYGAVAKNREATLLSFAATCLLEAAAVAVPFWLGDTLAVLANALRPLSAFGFLGSVAAWTAVTAIVVLPAALVAGYQFPMLIALLGKGRENVGRQVGLTYLFNTLGAIVGSLAGGFGLIPLLSAPGCWRLVAVALVVLGAAAIALSPRGERRSRQLAFAGALAVTAVLMVASTGPTSLWRHGGIGVGRSPTLSHRNTIKAWSDTARSHMMWESDGVESSVAVTGRSSYAMIINGKVDGNARLDAPTQVMSGVLAAFLHPDPRTSAVIGLGTGSTAGWLAALPTMERTDVIELEPVIARFARMCGPVNANALENPELRVTYGDARETLLTTPRSYDVIVSEPSNPYRAGIASLFTSEYYEAVASRLRPRGIFAQWIQVYDVDAQTVRTVIATLMETFQYVELWQVGVGDLVVLSSMEPIVHDVSVLRDRMRVPAYRDAMLAAWRAVDLEGVFGRFVAGPKLAQHLRRRGADAINTDDRNVVEFGFARTVGKTDLLGAVEVRDAAHQLGADRPEITGGTLDWDRVVDGEMELWLAGQTAPKLRAHWTRHQTARAQALLQWLAGNDRIALITWRRQPNPPRTPFQLAMYAEALARTGDPEAGRYIDRLRDYSAPEADVMTALVARQSGDLEAAIVALESAFAKYRSDPWPTPFVMKDGLAAAQQLSASANLAPRLYEALRSPFSVHCIDEDRRLAAFQVASRSEDPAQCVDALKAYEPYPPWTQETLEARLDCYARAGHRLAGQASDDLEEFLDNRALPFGYDAPDAPPSAP